MKVKEFITDVALPSFSMGTVTFIFVLMVIAFFGGKSAVDEGGAVIFTTGLTFSIIFGFSLYVTKLREKETK